ncbi:MAG TPA: transglycosylase domain-containing protein [Actinomycetes bacterium]|nr:transglycosylase domain-containing protein [Actinomycetes bacterium]
MAAPPITPTRAARHQQARPPGRERRQPPPSRSRLRRVLRWTLWLAVPAVAVAAGTIVGLIYAFARVPLPAEVPTAQTVVFLDQTGKREIGTLSAQENRRVVSLDRIPEHTRRAVLAAEDRDFYDHGAISYRGLARATAANLLRRRISEGGSTITQQYVKNAFPGVGRDRTLFRKLKEAVLAVKLERKFSKDKILEFYMNTVYFGRGAYGVDAAARTYFSVPGKRRVTAQSLTPAQSALLAGVIRSPEFYGRKDHAASAKLRRNYILQAMVDRGWLSAKEGRAAMASKLGVSWAAKPQGIANSQAPFFLEKVRQYLVARYGAQAVSLGGLRVRTTLDLDMQRQAEEAVNQALDVPSAPRAALVAMDPRTGAVRAMYGGRNFERRQFNYATNAIRQAGSTMKPFVLARALSDGISVNSVFPGPEELIVDGEDFKNYDDENYGQMTLTDATRLSVNTIYVQLMQQVQPKRVAQFARQHGLAAELDGRPGPDHDPRPLEDAPVLKPVLALSLGSGDVTTLQLASAFGTWANRGIHMAPHLVERVVDSQGRVIEDHRRQQGTQVVAPIVADTMNLVLRGAVENGTGFRAQLDGREVAGKTGTTSLYTDARFVGYTTDLVTSVWLGYDKPEKKLVDVYGLRGVSGGTVPAQIWHNFMDLATRDRPNAPFVVPAELGGQVLNSTTSTAPPTTVAPSTQPGLPGPPQPTFPPPQPGPPAPPTSQIVPRPGPNPTQP